jgi:hypothetical protein
VLDHSELELESFSKIPSMRILGKMRLVFMVLGFLLIVAQLAQSTPQHYKNALKTKSRVTHFRGTESQVRGTLSEEGDDDDNTQAVRRSDEKLTKTYGMSTPSYETLESQLQSPQLITIPVNH